MKKIKSHTLIFFIGVLLPCIVWVISTTVVNIFGADQTIEEQRALSLDTKGCYTWQDIEYVVFGEVQE